MSDPAFMALTRTPGMDCVPAAIAHVLATRTVRALQKQHAARNDVAYTPNLRAQ